MIIDAHSHVHEPVRHHIALLDEAGADRAVLFSTRRAPPVPLVISQLGGLNWLTAIGLARETPNLYLDLSTAGVVFAVRLAIDEVPDRTFFGSDAPYGDPSLARATVERVTRPGMVRDRVLGGTLAELLGL
ncbi:amidohydrolase family protein [Streptomyces nojiriensis]|uniref:amidohydrolase family protein n=1 Tax=Streptomyces nojiriensis TaxID=66374 RepID=UPI002E186CE4